MAAAAAFVLCPACREPNIPGTDTCWSCLAPLSDLGLPETEQPAATTDLNGTLDHVRLRRAVLLETPATVRDALELLRADPASGILVIIGGRVAGIFTERDVLLKVAGLPETLDRPITEFMTTDPVVLSEVDPMNVVLHKMAVGGFRHLPVLREGEPVGVITSSEVLRWVLLQYFD